MKSKRLLYLLIYVFVSITCIALIAITNSSGKRNRPDAIPFNEVAIAASEDRIEKITIDNDVLLIRFTDGSEASTTKDPASSAAEQLAAMGVSAEHLTAIEWEVAQPNRLQTYLAAITYILPMALVAGLILILLTRTQGAPDDPGTQ